MIRLIIVLIVLIINCHNSLNAQAFITSKHVVLISVDGLRPVFYLDQTWPAPMMQQMAREGAHAHSVIGVLPTVTYPSHTSIVTGSYVGNHGIYYNTHFDTGKWYFEYDSIRVPTLWDIVNDAGMITANVGWPVTLHAPINFNVPISGALQNSGLADDPIRKFTTPVGLFKELEREATGRIKQNDLLNSNPSKESRVAEMVVYLIREYGPNFITVALQHTDSYQHRYGLDHPRVRRAVAAADRAISRIVEAVEELGLLDETTFIITGDHGFTHNNAQIAPNIWLTENGFRSQNLEDTEWKATFKTSGGSAFLHLSNPNDVETFKAIKQILEELPSSVHSLFTIHGKDELDRLGANPEVQLLISGIAGISMSGASYGDYVRFSSGATHGHHPEMPEMHTGFIAWGSSIRSGVIVPLMNMVDIAPLIAQILGLSMESADGVLIPGLIIVN